MRSGVYEEQIRIGKPLVLAGAGDGMTTIRAPTHMASFGENTRFGHRAVAIVEIGDGAAVTMSGFTVMGPVPCGTDAYGILAIQGSALSVSDSHVTRVRPESDCAPDEAFGRGIAVGLPSVVRIHGERDAAAQRDG